MVSAEACPRLLRRRSQALIAAGACVATGLLALGPAAQAQNYDIDCSLLPYPYVTDCYNATVSWNWTMTFTTVGAYGDRRVKFTDHNPHSTRVSCNLSYDYSVCEVTDIPLNDHVAHYFTTLRSPSSDRYLRSRLAPSRLP